MSYDPEAVRRRLSEQQIAELALFAPPPHAAGSDTSAEAAAVVAPVLGKLLQRVLLAVVANRGASSDEVEQLTGLSHQTASARLWQLAGKDRRHPSPALVYESSERRPTRSGCSAVVYQPTAAGLALLHDFTPEAG